MRTQRAFRAPVSGEEVADHSLRSGRASSAEVEERYVQKHLSHALAVMTRRYQRRRDRFRVNLTKAAGLQPESGLRRAMGPRGPQDGSAAS